MEDSVSIDLFVKNNEDLIEKWFKKMKYFTPTKMLLNLDDRSKRFNQKSFFSELVTEINNDKFTLYYHNWKNWVSCHKSYENINLINLSAKFEKDNYEKKKEEIHFLINDIMKNYGIDARIVNSTDKYWQNDKHVYTHVSNNKSIEDIFAIDMFTNSMEKMPGYEIKIGEIWHGASWKMWFNTPYYEYVPKNILENYNDCYKNEKISSECICITLYEDVNDYDNPQNRELQLKFKRAINFDELVKNARADEIKKTQDPKISIQFGDYKNGGKRRVINYLDDEEKSTRRSKAVQAEVVYCDREGKFLFAEIKPIDEID